MSLNECGSAIYALLAAGTALVAELGGGSVIYDTLAPQDTDPPYVIYFQSGGGDDNMTPTRERSTVWTIKAVAETLQQAKDVDDEIDALLHGGTLTLASWTNIWTARENDVHYAEPGEAGRVYWHRGGQYRIMLTE